MPEKQHPINKKYHALALFSGGLDSILAIKTIEKQGLNVKCLHFVSPFFGSVEKVNHWKKIYNIDIDPIDIGEDYSLLLKNLPVYGFGSTLNPCVDCKILMMRKAKSLLEHYGASFIISGEVLGQRPMSQRRDTLNVIHRDGDVKDILLRPLCAKHMAPTQSEISGLVNRDLLHNFSGRGRTQQLELAKELGITEIPTPAGGCKLTEKDTSARYWNVLSKHNANADNFDLSNTGRQFWHKEDNTWLVIGRNKEDNEKLERICKKGDFLLRVDGFPSPLGLIRPTLQIVSNSNKIKALSLLASYSPKALLYSHNNQEANNDGLVENPLEVSVIIREILSDKYIPFQENASFEEELYYNETSVKCIPARKSNYIEPDWNEAKTAIQALKKQV